MPAPGRAAPAHALPPSAPVQRMPAALRTLVRRHLVTCPAVLIAPVASLSRALRSILKRFEARMTYTYAELSLCQHILLICGWSHLQACLWGLLPYFEEGFTWLAALEDAQGAAAGTLPPFDVYLASLYWSVMTVTSIGYGEMLPVNPVEHAVCTLCMLFSCTLWAYVMGSACAMAATMDPEGVAFRTNLDALNYFMRDRNLPQQERVALREYFHSSRKLQYSKQEAELLELMSPKQQGEVALRATQGWLERVWYLRPSPNENPYDHRSFVAAIAMKLVTKAFVTQERIGAGSLYILQRGLAVRRWRFLNAGKVWGEDMILDNQRLMDQQPAVCLTYCEVRPRRHVARWPFAVGPAARLPPAGWQAPSPHRMAPGREWRPLRL